jgi:hypothetical protein
MKAFHMQFLILLPFLVVGVTLPATGVPSLYSQEKKAAQQPGAAPRLLDLKGRLPLGPPLLFPPTANGLSIS